MNHRPFCLTIVFVAATVLLLPQTVFPADPADVVTLREVDEVIPTYKSGPPEPNPMFYFGRDSQGAEGRTYPYPLYDNLTNVRSEQTYRLVYLENKYIKIGIAPEIGGRLFSALDKTNNYDFVYRQHVIKPALIGLIGAWISGGIECQPFVSNGEIAGAVALVANRERVLHLSAVGQSDLASGRKMKTTDLFWIASMSKPVTAVAVAMLADDGKLSFDDPVEKYLPEFRDLWVTGEQTAERRVLFKAARPITLRDLLTHTSGLGEYRVTDPHWTLAAIGKVLAREPLRFQPGTRWGYSTAGTDLLGRVVEVVSGVSFAEFLRKRLFIPLGMKDTTFWISPAQKIRLAQSYLRNEQSGKLEPTIIGYMYGGAVTDHERPALGGAGLFSTAEDVARFYQMMLNRGALNGRQILKPGTVAEMTSKQTGDLRARAGMPWGLGFCVIEDPAQVEANATLSPGTFGHGGAFGTHSWADPTRGIVYVLMIQRDKLQPNPDNSAMRRAYQEAVAVALDGK